jgi:hypothetical protein
MLTKYYLKIYIAANNFSNVLCFDNHYDRDLYINDCKAYYKSGIYFSTWEISGNQLLQDQINIAQRQLQAGYDSQIADLQRRISKYKNLLSSKCSECIYKSQADTLQKSYDRIRDNYKDAQEKYKHILDTNNNTYSIIDTLAYTDSDKTINEYTEQLQDSLQKVGELRQINVRLVLAYILNLIDNAKRPSNS